MKKHNLTTEEKIDYIYDTLRKQQRMQTFGSILKWGTRLFVVASLLYFFFIKLPVLKDEIIESITPEVPQFDIETITNSDVLESIKKQFQNIGKKEMVGDETQDENKTIKEPKVESSPNYY